MDSPIVIDCGEDVNNQISDIKIAVFVNLYYVDEYEWCMKYLLNIPSFIDIYISTSNDKLLRMLKKDERHKKNTHIVNGFNRGRDIGALLVTLKEYIRKYDIICFVHDKKRKEYQAAEYVNLFTECIWENLLSSEKHILRVVSCFANDTHLGLLLPPLVAEKYSGMWHFVWENNYDNTIKAAEIIGLDDARKKIENGFCPSSYGTTFWARTKAIKKLLDYNWKYEDFSSEPAPDDSTMSHALERLVELVVMDAGYEVKNVFSTKYAQKHIGFIQNELLKHTKLMHNTLGNNTFQQDEVFLGLREKVYHYNKKYIYGAGKIGHKCYKMLKMLNINVDAFVITEGASIEKQEIPVIQPDNIEKEDSIVIISIANKDDVMQIKNTLLQRNINCFSLLYD